MTFIKLYGTEIQEMFKIDKGHLDLPWNFEHRWLKYKHQPFNDAGAAMLWKTWGYTNITGDMYDARNPAPEWFDLEFFKKIFPWEHLQWSFYRMGMNTVLPEHVDKFLRFKELFKSKGELWRAVVFLEDWHPGHLLTMGDKQWPQWTAGDYVAWEESTPHMAANCGVIEKRYTLQLTGFKS